MFSSSESRDMTCTALTFGYMATLLIIFRGDPGSYLNSQYSARIKGKTLLGSIVVSFKTVAARRKRRSWARGKAPLSRPHNTSQLHRGPKGPPGNLSVEGRVEIGRPDSEGNEVSKRDPAHAARYVKSIQKSGSERVFLPALDRSCARSRKHRIFLLL